MVAAPRPRRAQLVGVDVEMSGPGPMTLQRLVITGGVDVLDCPIALLGNADGSVRCHRITQLRLIDEVPPNATIEAVAIITSGTCAILHAVTTVGEKP